jgi:hypothetical protein
MNSTYGVELLYKEAPILRKGELLAALRKRLPEAAPLNEDASDGLLAFIHRNAMVRYEDGEAPAQLLVQVMPQVPRGPEVDAALRQSWNFDDVDEVVASCTASVIVTDVLASRLPHRLRYHLFSNSVLAVLDIAPAAAIHWRPSQQFIDPREFVTAATGGDLYAFAAAGLNVRFFNIADSEGEMLMDTLGLESFGLPDFQCHFRDLDPDAVGRYLHNMGVYTYENGDAIEDGQVVEGLEAGTQWRFQHEDSLADPERGVIDIDPGDPYAAGERSRDRD